MFTAFAALTIAPALAQSVAETRPPLVTNALTIDPSAEPAYAFEGEITLNDRSVALRVNPTADGEARVEVINPPEESLGADQRAAIAELRNEPDLDLWCADPDLAARDFSLLSETEETATFRFQPLPEPGTGDDAFTQNLTGELVVSKNPADVVSLRVYAPAAFKPNFMAKIDRFESVTTCELAPNGRRYAAEVRTNVAGEAMFSPFEQSVVQRVTEVLAPTNVSGGD